ncbi:18315_t:CDS:2 [Dentiscutata erythropus]|uniref:18315_t:CDS:1 n=1 Tax=Dentiscutata erythropus TaxID=1348616 RepID=A0A9N8Z2R5_9GLOM|nr:18315_t:CDS:2 [Dentiscutata erythropus]
MKQQNIISSILIEAPPIHIFTVSNLRRFAYYAAASYCNLSLNNWDCGEVCKATEGTQFVKMFNDDEFNTKGYIALDKQNKLIIVAYRGTIPGSIKNWHADLAAYQDSYNPVRGVKVHHGFYKPVRGVKVHHGFYKTFKRLQPKITDVVIRLHQNNPNFRIGLIGHSLGGALAALSALDLMQKVPHLVNNDALFLSTFGQPRVGNSNFAEYVDNNLKLIARTIVHGDPVPRLPSSNPIPYFGSYKHFGEELYINNPNEDPNSFIYESLF